MDVTSVGPQILSHRGSTLQSVMVAKHQTNPDSPALKASYADSEYLVSGTDVDLGAP